MSQGAYALGDGWVLGGLVLFVVLAVVAEVVMWPAERRLQQALAAVGTGSDPAPAPTLQADAATLERSATVVLVLLLAGTVVMIAQP
jgi:uncharacterized membrane protein